MKKFKMFALRTIVHAKRYYAKLSLASKLAYAGIALASMLALVFFGPVIALQMGAISVCVVAAMHDMFTRKGDAVMGIMGQAMGAPAIRAAAEARRAAAAKAKQDAKMQKLWGRRVHQS